MKFEFERLSVAFIERRIREEQAKQKRLVTTVTLTPDEWFEFMNQPDMRNYCHDPLRRVFEIAICDTPSCVPPSDYPPRDWGYVQRVQVIRGR